MALRKTLAINKRCFDAASRVTKSAVTSPLSSVDVLGNKQTVVPPHAPAARANFHHEYITSTDTSEKGFFRRFLPHSTTRLPEFLSLPVGEKLREKLKGTTTNNKTGSSDRISLDGLRPPPSNRATVAEEGSLYGVTIGDTRKIMRLFHVEKLKTRLREIPESSVSYAEFHRICMEGCESEEQGPEFAKLLDDSGSVIVLGSVVFLRPEQVAKSMERIISQTMELPNDRRRRVLDQLEEQKMVIDQKARNLVQAELYGGLGFILLQTLAAMRLTFWELSWDVMEPICFFVTSIHFALGYGFFLKTSTEPTFQGLFHHRFITKQRRLMEALNFDVHKYNQLRKLFYPNSSCLTMQKPQPIDDYKSLI